MNQPKNRTSAVPRLYKLSYLEVVLREAYQGASFERMRQALLEFARRNGDGQDGGGIISRLHNEYTYWSPTQEAIAELMRLGLIVRDQLPSSRQYVDAYRARAYALTPEGEEAVQGLSGKNGAARAKFLDMLTVALSKAHPGFANLIEVVSREPLIVPEYSLEGISVLGNAGPLTRSLAKDAILRMVEHWPSRTPEPSEVALAEWLDNSLKRRFPKNRARQPSRKDILDTINDAVLGYVASVRNIQLDPISFNVSMSWAGQLAVLEQSRYVEGWNGRTVWATAHISDHNVNRRGFREDGMRVVEELLTGYKTVADATSDEPVLSFLPIHRVRAQAAFATKVNLRFVDMILRRVLSGEMAAPYQVRVALGRGTPPPKSEPVFTHDGRRFFHIMITTEGGQEE